MSKNLQIHIAEPCHESWEKMDEAGKGRFCSSCSKTVIDFTLMSDQQVLSYLNDPKRKVCGRFASDQLDRDFTVVKERGKKPWSVVWRLAVVGMLLSAKGQAQQRYPKPGISKLVKKKAAKKIVGAPVSEMGTVGMITPRIVTDTDSFALPGGIYFVRLSSTGSGAVYTQKLVVL
ncbi:MAG TPA: hypothetical protein VK563_05045 [Puia sp.]|nr:hypothetical protein [Puia sp.]